MWLVVFTALALSLVSIAHAKPSAASFGPLATNVNLMGVFPVFDLDVVQPEGNNITTKNTAGNLSVSVDSPTTLFLCQEPGCVNCISFNLNVFPHETCIFTSFDFVSVVIDQPSNDGLSFAVFAGTPNCTTLALVPLVNGCFNTPTYLEFNTILLNP